MKSSSRINKQEQVQVVIRLKPESPENKYQRCAYLASEDSNALVVQVPNKKQYFVFDAIANQDTSQFELYQNIGRQVVTQGLQGYNCCIFAYGQTGSGKTYSILGILSDIVENIYAQTRGILPRLLEDMFKNVSSSNKCVVKCSYMEIYNEQIYDLLGDGVQFLQIRQGPQRGVYVEGLNLFTVNSYQDAINLVLQGERNRKIAQTGMNKESSRSHTIFTVNTEMQIMQEDTIRIRKSKINIVDLAGSQRVKHTNVEGERLREGCNINRSLHVLGNVINALVESTKKKKHIPFRDSKLTYYLKDSLGGNSITKLLANIQCNSKFLGDTLSTLMFAKRAKILKMKVQINQNTTQNYDALRKQIKKLRQQLAQAKYINETRLSDRFQTQNETEFNLDKYETSNFEYSCADKTIQVFEQNQLHYKALIQIYEDHMRQCTVLNNENFNHENNSFSKKKQNNILSHSEWKKLEKKNTALMSLINRIPAFTKIYRQNQLLKQQRKQQRKQSKNYFLSQTQQKIPAHSTTLNLQQSSSQLQILHQSSIPSQQQQLLIQHAIQKTTEQYEEIINEMKVKFTQCLNQLDQSYGQLQKQVEEKDRKIKEIIKGQGQLPSNIEELIDENEYLKLNVLELEAQIMALEKQLQHNIIKQREEGRRYSLFQEPLSSKKLNEPTQNNHNWLTQSLNMKQQELQNNPKKIQSLQKLIQTSDQLQLVNEMITSLQNLKQQALKHTQQYNTEKQQMLECIRILQKQCKSLMNANKAMMLRNQDIKAEKNKLIEQILKLNPDFTNDKKQMLKSTEDLWKQINSQKSSLQNIEEYKKQVQFQIQSLYEKLKETQKIKQQLSQFVVKQKTAQKQFGKSINEILDQYAEMIQNKSNQQSISLNSRHSSHKILVSPRNSKFIGQFSGGQIKNTRQYKHKPNMQPQPQQKNSRASSRASQDRQIVGVRSPKK